MLQENFLKKIFSLVGILVLVGVMVLGNSLLFAQPKEKPELPEQASEVAKVKIEKVWEMKFDEEVVDVIMPTDEEIQALQKNGENPRLKLIVGKKMIKFLDNEGNVIKEKKLAENSKVEVSKNRKNIGIITPKYEILGHPPVGLEFRLLDEDGNEIAFKEQVLLGDYSEDYDILGNGENVVIKSGHEKIDTVSFYKVQNGNLLLQKTINFSEIGGVGGFESDYSTDGNYYCISTRGYKKNNAEAILFDNDGNKLWSCDLSEAFEDIYISRSGSYIVATSRKIASTPQECKRTLYLISNLGKTITQYPIEPVGSYEADFSSNEKFLGITSGMDVIYFFESETGKLLWEYKDTEKTTRFGPIWVSENGENVFVWKIIKKRGIKRSDVYRKDGTRREKKEYIDEIIGKEKYILIFNGEGKLISEDPFDREYHSFRISQDGKHISVFSSDESLLYKVSK